MHFISLLCVMVRFISFFLLYPRHQKLQKIFTLARTHGAVFRYSFELENLQIYCYSRKHYDSSRQTESKFYEIERIFVYLYAIH